MSKKISYSIFVSIFVSIFIIFVLFHIVTWEMITKPIMTSNYGDLARVGYQPASFQERKTEVLLPKKHIKAPEWRGEEMDVVTVGDSFSIGSGGGLNPYYQDYIVSRNGLSVLNIERDYVLEEKEHLNYLVALINSGFLTKIKAKILIVESVERLALVRYANDINRSHMITANKIMDGMLKVRHGNYPDISLINAGNYKYFLYNFYYEFSPNAFGKSETYRYHLDRDLFNSQASNVLLFYNQDITTLSMITPPAVKLLNDNMNELARMLKEKGIVLIFMPPVDKYDLYSNYIIENPHPKNHFFDLLRPLEKEYYFVDTKKILSKFVENNVTDVYHADDSHWTYKASEAVVRSIPFQKLIANKDNR